MGIVLVIIPLIAEMFHELERAFSLFGWNDDVAVSKR